MLLSKIKSVNAMDKHEMSQRFSLDGELEKKISQSLQYYQSDCSSALEMQ